MATEDRVLRQFWVHQLVEYVLGLMLVAMGAQSPQPVFPVLAGGLIVLNAALVTGPLGAWRAVSRPMHRRLDLGVMAIVGLVAVQPLLSIDNMSRLVMLGVVAVLALVWTTTDFTDPAVRRRGGGRGRTSSGEAIGRGAGRLVNLGRSYVRDRSRRSS